MHVNLEAFVGLLEELFEVTILLSDLCKHLLAFLGGILRRTILGVDHTLHEVRPLGHEVVAVIQNGNSVPIELDVVELDGDPHGNFELRPRDFLYV